MIDRFGSFNGTTGLVLNFGPDAIIFIEGDGLTQAAVVAAIEIF